MIGRAVEHYQIVEKLGAGGMGEVYRARDTKLDRDVALKVLPAGFALDPERKARFEREARVLAALNHPNVASVYGVGEQDGVHYLVMECVPGRPLRTPLPVAEALAVCRQIAEALEAAHERGIVHRDLKPQNVVITPDGKAKVLDFGLAKIVREVADVDEMPTASEAGTETGKVMGTVAYMSPEQARGRPLDKRTDIWSFGCVLYEALAGIRLFRGESASDTLAAILTTEPDLARLPAETPPRVRDLLRRCLQKDPARRLRDIGDARLEIEDVLSGSSAVAPAFPADGRRLWPILVAAAAVLASLLGWWGGRRTASPDSQKTELRTIERLTEFVGLEESPAVSPDGKAVAFTAAVAGRQQIWVRLLAGGAPLQLTRDAVDHRNPRWAPDSNAILYYSPTDGAGAGGTLFEVPALGGVPRRVVDSLGEGDVSHDGKSVVYFQAAGDATELRIAARDGSAARTLARLRGTLAYRYPRFSPDDTWIAFQRGSVNISGFDQGTAVVSSQGGEPRPLGNTRQNGLAWLPDGSGLVYSSAVGSTALYWPSFNLWTVDVHGRSQRQLTFGDDAYVEPDLGKSGVFVASRMKRASDVWKFPVGGAPSDNVRRAIRVTQQTGILVTPSVSPGEREIVYLSESGGHANLWIQKLDATREARQITFETDPRVIVGLPVWSPDGARIAYVRQGGGGPFLDTWIVHPDGSGRRKVEEDAAAPGWSADGRWLYYGIVKENVWRLFKAPAEGGPRVLVSEEDGQGPQPSPDGRTVFFVVQLHKAPGSDYELRAAPESGGPSRLVARIPGRRIPSWQIFNAVLSPDGRELAVLLTDGPATNIWTFSTADGRLRAVTDFGNEPVFITRRVSWSPDGRHLYGAVGRGDADVVQLSGFDLR